MKYNILITYNTGDSFKKVNGVETLLELNCDLETADENLNRIREHYSFYNNVNSCRAPHQNLKEIEKNVAKKSWYGGEYWEGNIKLLNSEGETFIQSVDWCGYFERLVCGEVVPAKKSLPKFEF